MSEQNTINYINGTVKLKKPIRARSEDVTELKYDFDKVTGWEYAEAMGMDTDSRNVFTISHKQALALFAKAAEKAMDGVLDARDIRERLGTVDAVTAVQLAVVFIRASIRDAEKNS